MRTAVPAHARDGMGEHKVWLKTPFGQDIYWYVDPSTTPFVGALCDLLLTAYGKELKLDGVQLKCMDEVLNSEGSISAVFTGQPVLIQNMTL